MSVRWIALAALAVGCGVVVIGVVNRNALAIQVVAAAVGAALTFAGAALGISAWPERREEIGGLLVSVGFFGFCVGAFLMLAGIGIYH